MKIGVFGSACNPITMGHYDAILQGLKYCDIVLIVPSFKHPFNKNMIDFNIRCDLVESFISDMGITEDVFLSKVEMDIYDGENPVYTYNVLNKLSEIYSCDEIVFLCGEDVYDSLDKFHMHEYIKDNWEIIKLNDVIKIRSTLVRSAINSNNDISSLVSKTVENKIKDNKYFYSNEKT